MFRVSIAVLYSVIKGKHIFSKNQLSVSCNTKLLEIFPTKDDFSDTGSFFAVEIYYHNLFIAGVSAKLI